ncbi:hypothetical protein RBB50_012592 [Rhinocladiella similis]
MVLTGECEEQITKQSDDWTRVFNNTCAGCRASGRPLTRYDVERNGHISSTATATATTTTGPGTGTGSGPTTTLVARRRPNALVRRQDESTMTTPKISGINGTSVEDASVDNGDVYEYDDEDEDKVQDGSDDSEGVPYCQNWDAFVVYHTWSQMLMRIYHFQHWVVLGVLALVFLLCYGSLDLGRLQ